MNLIIVSGSHRKESNSIRCAHFIKSMLSSSDAFTDVSILDLSKNDIPLWDEGVWENHPSWEKWFAIEKSVTSADAFVFICPEWGGMVPPALKNFLLLCSHRSTGHKPVYIIGISHSNGGAFPIFELRSSGYKNSKLCFICEHLILRGIGEFIDLDFVFTQGSNELMRLRYGLDCLSLYAKALSVIRGELNAHQHADLFKYGMS